jgi:hypothetical protein
MLHIKGFYYLAMQFASLFIWRRPTHLRKGGGRHSFALVHFVEAVVLTEMSLARFARCRRGSATTYTITLWTRARIVFYKLKSKKFIHEHG